MDKEQPGTPQRAAASPGRAIALVIGSMVLAVALNAGFTLWSIGNSRQQQQHQGEIVERKICTTIAHLDALKPPGGNPRANPSRAFDDRLHASLAQLGPDLGCT